MTAATKNAHDWHCEDHDTFGWRGEACRQCPEAPSEITTLRTRIAELEASPTMAAVRDAIQTKALQENERLSQRIAELEKQLAANKIDERIEKLTAQVGVLRDGIEAYLAANDPSEFGCACDPSVGYLCGPCFADKQLYNALAAWREMTTDHIKPAGKEDQAVYDSIARNYYK